jgi:hypothetical protein
MADPTGRAQFRAMLLSIFETIPGVTVYSPGDWNLTAPKLPAIKLRQGRDKKESLGRIGETQFKTVTSFEIRFEVSAKSAEAALLSAETYGAEIEAAIFKSIPLRAIAQDFPFCETETDVTAEGGPHVAGLSIQLGVEFPEVFDPDINTQLLRMTIDADLVNVVDKLGTYPDAPFPDAVQPDPRTEGPDGRAEGGLDIQFPQ